MKTLKELKEKCTLIAEFKHPAFVTKYVAHAVEFEKPIKGAIYYDNKKMYYLYMYINKAIIIEYDNIENILDRLTRFINNTINPHE